MPLNQFACAVPVIPTAAPAFVTRFSDVGRPYADMPCKAQAGSNATLYGVNKRRNPRSVADFASVSGDGSTRAVTGLSCVTGANIVDASELTAAASLRFVCTVDGVPLIRVGSDVAPADGEFSISTGARAVASLTFTAQPEEGGTVLIEDGSGFLSYFEFGTDYGTYAASGYDLDSVEIGSTIAETAGNLVDAINDSALEASAVLNADGSISVVLAEAGADLGSVTLAGTTNLTAVDFAGGADDGAYITLGTIPLVDEVVELHRYDADEVYSLSLTADVIAGSRVYDFMGTATAVANLSN